MKNKMTTLLGKIFSNNKKIVLQHEDQTLKTTTETFVISFDHEKFEEILSQSGNSPLLVRQHRKITLTKAPLAVSLKPISFEANQTQRETKQSSGKARRAQYEPDTISGEVSKTLLQSAVASGEARYPTLSQLPTRLKGTCPLSALSVAGETKAFYNAKSQASSEAKAIYNAKSQASGKAKAFYNAKSPASCEVTTLSSARPSGEVTALSCTKFTALEAKLASCEAISKKAEASKVQATDKINAICGTNKASGEASAHSGTKFKAFYKAKDASGNVKPTSCKVKAKATGKACPVLSKTKATVSGNLALLCPEQRH